MIDVRRIYQSLAQTPVVRPAFRPLFTALMAATRRGSAPHPQQERLQQLARDGITQAPAFASADEVAELRTLVHTSADRARAAFLDAPASLRRVPDPAHRCTYTRSEWHELDGRDRAELYRLEDCPPPLRRFIEDKGIIAFGDAYFGHRCQLRSVLLERYEPVRYPEHEWHFDTMGDELKLMLLLSDTDLRGGPLRYKVGSHVPHPALWPLYELSYRRGQAYHAPSGFLVNELPGELRYGVGAAGDGVWFDTRGVHSTTQLEVGQRLCVVFKLRPWSPINVGLRLLGSRFE
jgi:hypothetical protein